MPRKKVEDRVNAKRKARYTVKSQQDKEKKVAPRSHKSFQPVMRKPQEYELPEDVCSRLGHKEIILAQSATKKIVVCARLCGLFKVTEPR